MDTNDFVSKEEKIGDYFIKFSNKKLDEIESKIKEILELIKDITESEYNNQVINKINKCKSWLIRIINPESKRSRKNDKIKKDNFFKELQTTLNEFNDNICKIINNFHQIEKLNNDIDEIYYDLKNFDFFPPDNDGGKIKIHLDSESTSNNYEENKDISLLNIIPSYASYISRNREIIENDDGEEEQKCSFCDKKAIKIYKKNNKFYCETCFTKLYEQDINIDMEKDIIDLKTFKNEREKGINFFLNSISYMIKIILTKANYILNNTQKKFKDMDNNTNDIFIYQIINYPKIQNENDYNSQIKFLKDIDSILINEFGLNNLNNDNFYTSDLNHKLKEEVKNIFKDEKYNIIKNEIDKLDFNFDLFSDEMMHNESYEIKNILLDKFYYYIHLISKEKKEIGNENIKHIKKIKSEIIENFNKNLSINKNNILVAFNNDQTNFINAFVKTENFSKLSLKEIKLYYPHLNELYKFKLLINELLEKQCQIRNYLDYKGNFISSLKENTIKGKNNNTPFNGWIGIGLKVLGK